MRYLEEDYRLIQIVPQDRQSALAKLEFYAFFHFGICTYTDSEWGTGSESPSLFFPEKMDAGQWVRAIKAAGMKGAVLTCKHHDGFCLWPSRFTEHTVAFSPYLEGKGDIVRQVSLACKEEGLKFGVYLSPWDRNQPLYGTGKAYDDYFVNQLTELLTGYGEIFMVWFDGACGEGNNGKQQIYDWERYYEVIRRHQPGACISVCGPDVRWCGNEGGLTRESEWSVVPKGLSMAERIKGLSQQEDSPEFRMRSISSKDEDLGSRAALFLEEELIWYPSEVDTSIRPGWFYHASEDEKISSLDELVNLYYRSAGGNSTLLLNIPPNPDGLLAAPDVKRLSELGQYLLDIFQNNLAEAASISVSWAGMEYMIDEVRWEGDGNFFQTPEKVTDAEFCICFPEAVTISHVVMKEHILSSQRIEGFEILAETENEFLTVASGSTVGYKKIVKFQPVTTKTLKVHILDSRVNITMEFMGVY